MATAPPIDLPASESSHHHQYEQLVEILASDIRELYLHTSMYMCPLTWAMTADSLYHVDQMYVTPRLAETQSATGTDRGMEWKEIPFSKLLTSETIKQSPHKSRRILVEGISGGGKTGLCQMLSRNWAKRSSIVYNLNTYSLLILIHAGQMFISEAIANYISRVLLSEDIGLSPRIIDKVLTIESIQEAVVFVVDGYDERKLPSTEMDDLICKKLYPLSTVLVTSRPGINIDGFIQSFDAIYSILDFSVSLREQLVDKFTSDSTDELSSKLASRANTVMHFLTTPLFIWFYVFLGDDYFDDKDFLTKTQFMKAVMQASVKKVKERFITVESSTFDAAFDNMKKHAYHSLQNNTLDIIRQLSDEEISLGFANKVLYRNKERVEETIYKFTHKLIPDYLAAAYIMEQPESETVKMLKTINEVSDKQARATSDVLLFVFGMASIKTNLLFELIHAFIPDDQVDELSLVRSSSGHFTDHLALTCLAECGQFNDIASLLLQRVPLNLTLNNAGCMQYCMRSLTESLMISTDFFLEHLRLDLFDTLSCEKDQLFNVIQRCKKVSLFLYDDHLTDLLDTVSGLSLENLGIVRCKTLPELHDCRPAALVLAHCHTDLCAEAIKACSSSVSHVLLEDITITPTGLASLCDALSCVRSVDQLDLRNLVFKDEEQYRGRAVRFSVVSLVTEGCDSSSVAAFLNQTQLTGISIENAEYSEEDLAKIADALQTKQNFKEFSFRHATFNIDTLRLAALPRTLDVSGVCGVVRSNPATVAVTFSLVQQADTLVIQHVCFPLPFLSVIMEKLLAVHVTKRLQLQDIEVQSVGDPGEWKNIRCNLPSLVLSNCSPVLLSLLVAHIDVDDVIALVNITCSTKHLSAYADALKQQQGTAAVRVPRMQFMGVIVTDDDQSSTKTVQRVVNSDTVLLRDCSVTTIGSISCLFLRITTLMVKNATCAHSSTVWDMMKHVRAIRDVKHLQIVNMQVKKHCGADSAGAIGDALIKFLSVTFNGCNGSAISSVLACCLPLERIGIQDGAYDDVECGMMRDVLVSTSALYTAKYKRPRLELHDVYVTGRVELDLQAVQGSFEQVSMIGGNANALLWIFRFCLASLRSLTLHGVDLTGEELDLVTSSLAVCTQLQDLSVYELGTTAYTQLWKCVRDSDTCMNNMKALGCDVHSLTEYACITDTLQVLHKLTTLWFINASSDDVECRKVTKLLISFLLDDLTQLQQMCVVGVDPELLVGELQMKTEEARGRLQWKHVTFMDPDGSCIPGAWVDMVPQLVTSVQSVNTFQ